MKTAQGLDCSVTPNDNGGDWTGHFDNIKCYDQLKVDAVLHWIHGQNHMGTADARMPNVFGMNFQAALDDANVRLLVSNPRLHARTVTSAVETAQVAPTILESLGLDPQRLDGVRKEGTPALPGIRLED